MAFFERADERDQLIVCNICNVKCNERSITQHKFKCAEKNAHKFKNGELVRCKYDQGHIVKPDKLSLHLEFCTKRQNQLKDEYQREVARSMGVAVDQGPSPINFNQDTNTESVGDWGAATDAEPRVVRFSKLNIK
jgi:hypothetical protein